MTKEQVQERIQLLETEREQVKATLLAYEGALQESRHWLAQLEKTPENE